MQRFVILALLGAFFVPQAAFAETVLRVGSDISVEAGQVIEDDYYVSVGPVGRTTMSGEVAGDMLVFAGTALVNGLVGQDLLVVAGSAQVHASTTDDVRILAGEAVVSEYVGGDLFVFAGTLQVPSTATVAGDIFFFGGDAVIEGTVKGSLYGAAERVRVAGSVDGDIDMRVPAGLTLADTAVVGGGVTYTSARTLQRAPGAQVAGEVTAREIAPEDAREVARAVLTPLFVLLFATLSLYLLFKRGLEGLVGVIAASPVSALGVGAATLFAAPMVGILLCVTVLGIFLGVLTLGAFAALVALAIPLMGVVVGALGFGYFRGAVVVSLPTIVAGTALTIALLAIPVIGPLFVITAFLMTLGGLTKSGYHILHTRAE